MGVDGFDQAAEIGPNELQVGAEAPSQRSGKVDVEAARGSGFGLDEVDRLEVEFGADAIADALVEFFPRVPGEVVGVSGNSLVADFGKKQGVKPNTYLVLVHEEPPFVDDSTGDILMEGYYTTIGRARIGVVQDARSIAKLVVQEGDEQISVEKGTPVITY